jgi:hypothetical protein
MPMSIVSANAKMRKRILLGWVKAIASIFVIPNELQDIDRGEFEQTARDLNLSTSELYVLSNKAGLTGELLKRRLAEFKLSAERAGRGGRRSSFRQGCAASHDPGASPSVNIIRARPFTESRNLDYE